MFDFIISATFNLEKLNFKIIFFEFYIKKITIPLNPFIQIFFCGLFKAFNIDLNLENLNFS